MEVEFRKKYLRELYETGKTTDKKHRFQPQIINGYLKCVKALDEAIRMEDLYGFNALHYEKLSGDKKGLSSLRINNQYRLEFLEIANLDDKSKIEICSLTDITSHYK
ncbi:MAG: type II toxin-antitoxin system RelE/ParE family toxin [Mariniphaga sp.]